MENIRGASSSNLAAARADDWRMCVGMANGSRVVTPDDELGSNLVQLRIATYPKSSHRLFCHASRDASDDDVPLVIVT